MCLTKNDQTYTTIVKIAEDKRRRRCKGSQKSLRLAQLSCSMRPCRKDERRSKQYASGPGIVKKAFHN